MSLLRQLYHKRLVRRERMSRGKVGLARAPFERGAVGNYSASFTPRARIDRKHHPIDTFKGLVEANDEVVSLITREREPACIVCGSTEELTNGHLFSRRYYSTRFDVTPDGNCQVQCWGCNKRHQHDKDPYTFAFVRRFGGEAHARVRDRAFNGEKPTKLELRETLDSNRALLRQMRKAH